MDGDFYSTKPQRITVDDVRLMAQDLPQMISAMDVLAKLIRAKFDALKREGFSDVEALELCKS